MYICSLFSSTHSFCVFGYEILMTNLKLKKDVYFFGPPLYYFELVALTFKEIGFHFLHLFNF